MTCWQFSRTDPRTILRAIQDHSRAIGWPFSKEISGRFQEDLMATFQGKLQGHSQDHSREIGWLFSKAIPGKFQDDLRAVLQGYSN